MKNRHPARRTESHFSWAARLHRAQGYPDPEERKVSHLIPHI